MIQFRRLVPTLLVFLFLPYLELLILLHGLLLKHANWVSGLLKHRYNFYEIKAIVTDLREKATR